MKILEQVVCVICSKLTKSDTVDLIDMILRNIDVALVSLFLTLKFNQIMQF